MKRFPALLLGLFAAIALSLATAGIYGIIALSVAARTREIGIRIALGADQGRVQRSVVGEGLALVSIGAAIGLAGALVATRVLSALLFDLSTSDPITYVGALVLLGAAAVLASWLPARRASRVDPVSAFRNRAAARVGRLAIFPDPMLFLHYRAGERATGCQAQ